MSQPAGRSRGSTRLQRLSTSSSTSSTSSTTQLGHSRSSASPSTTRKVPLSPTTISATAFKPAFNSVPPIVNIVVSPHTNLKSFQTEFSISSSSQQILQNKNNINNADNAINYSNNEKNIKNNTNNQIIDIKVKNDANNVRSAVSSSSKSTAASAAASAASKSKTTKMCAAAVDVRSMSHSPSPMIEANNNLVDRKTGLPYKSKNATSMKGVAGSGSSALVNGTSSSHVQVYKEGSISLKPSNGLQDQVPQPSNSPQMYSVSLAFKTPKLHYSNQLYIYPYYVVTFSESAQSKVEADVSPSQEKQIKYCNVFYFDFNSQPQQPTPPPEEEEEEEEEEWTEFYEEVHHTTVITETKTEAANAFHTEQQAAAQQTVMYSDNLALSGGGGVGVGGGGGGGGVSGESNPPLPAPPSKGDDSPSLKSPASTYKGPSLADVISLEDSPGGKNSSKKQTNGLRH